MKVTAIICGRNGNTTELLAKRALFGAREEGCEVSCINLMDLDIRPCINCGSCVRRLTDPAFPGVCPLSDDMRWLDERILESDALIFAAAMMENAAPGVYKTMCDRMGPSHDVTHMRHIAAERRALGMDTRIDERWFKPRPAAFISHGGSEWSFLGLPSVETPAVSLGLTVVGRAQFDWNVGIIMDDARLERAADMGRHIGRVLKKQPSEWTYEGDPGCCPVCHNHVMALDPESDQAVCCVCGVTGTLCVENGKTRVRFTQAALERSHLLESGREIHRQDMIRNTRKARSLDMAAKAERSERFNGWLPNKKPR